MMYLSRCDSSPIQLSRSMADLIFRAGFDANASANPTCSPRSPSALRPFQIAREIRVVSSTEHPVTTNDVQLWWGLFIGSAVVGYVPRITGIATTPQSAAVVFLLSSGMSLGAALACVRMVKGIERRQADRARELLRA